LKKERKKGKHEDRVLIQNQTEYPVLLPSVWDRLSGTTPVLPSLCRVLFGLRRRDIRGKRNEEVPGVDIKPGKGWAQNILAFYLSPTSVKPNG
jgi:hypothetical protein